MTMPELTDADLAGLEAEVGTAVATGSTDGLNRLGSSEMTLVLGWPH